MMNKNYDFSYTQDRELSWLKFNERVLREADKKNVPIFERLKFLEYLRTIWMNFLWSEWAAFMK